MTFWYILIGIVVFLLAWLAWGFYRYTKMANDELTRKHKDKYNKDADREFERMNGWR